MIGKFQIQLTADNFASGMASSDNATDGSLGLSTRGINPFVVPGTIYALSTGVDASANITGNIIASCEQSQGATDVNRQYVDASGGYYTLSGTTITKAFTGSATTHYIEGVTDMVAQGGKTYVSLDNDIALWTTFGTPALDETWWSVTKSKSALTTGTPHPMLSYFDHLYVADGYQLHSIKLDGTIDTDIPAMPLTLNTNESIHAMGIDPGTGQMLLSIKTTNGLVSSSASSADTLSAKFYIGLYNGTSAYLTRKVPVDDLVTAFHNVGGLVYIAYGNRLGQWNGAGITFLRKFRSVTFATTSLINKHKFSSTGNILHVADGLDLLSYGEVMAGKGKGFFYTVGDTPSQIQVVSNIGGGKIAVAYATHKLLVYDFNAKTIGGGVLVFNNIWFPRPVIITRMRVVTTGITTGTDIGQAFFYDENGQISSQVSRFNVANGTKNVFDFDYLHKCIAVQPSITISDQAFGLVRIYIYYNIAE